ncbi:hypothetical protein BDF20DRAFT_903004 [Mycotypha africana]|uniref:uncharacterized protein n=1 Tax=Mycotypha africana TaxID=64632 RepID=UPI002300AB17|nr:uncharacterized protein BDF20DRAFT_903004 [Mycotypha africana]KAI8967028.1 hypothetical protein BDF20DRAFT_903004 [Mycotypha africana]
MKENKFTMGEEDSATAASSKAVTTSSPKNTTTQQHKRPVRHHVKRRSSGRVHVAKLAPMARVNSNTNVQQHSNNNNDIDASSDFPLAEDRPVIMRRSQSQKSLHKMSFERKGLAALTPTPTSNGHRRKSNASLDKITLLSEMTPTASAWLTNGHSKPILSAASPPTPTMTTYPKDPITKLAPTQSSISLPIQNKNYTKLTTTSNPVFLSNSKTVAEPVEQTFNAVADNLTTAESLKLSTTPTATMSSLLTSKKPNTSLQRDSSDRKLLKSQFITHTSTPDAIPPVDFYSNNSDDSSLHDSIEREFDCIQKYEDPMRSSLLRCMERLDLIDPNNTHTKRRLQVGHSMSTSLVPTAFSTSFASSTSTSSSSDNYESTNTAHSAISYITPSIEPHREQRRQIAMNRHQHLKAIASNNSHHRQQYQQQFKSHSYNPSSTMKPSYHHPTSNNSSGRLLAALPRNAANILDKWFSSHNYHASDNHH